MAQRRSASFYWLGVLFVLFLYGPMLAIVVLSFQGPEGGLTFPMSGVSLHWFSKLWSDGLPNVDIWSAFGRSARLGAVVMLLTVLLSLMTGLAYRKGFVGSNVLFYTVVASLGAHLTWTLPFGLLIMFAIFNRFDPRYEEAARDLGASPWQALRHVVLPIIGASVVGIGLFGFTLSWDEIARTSQAVGYLNTLPLELQGQTTTVTTPVIYALGTLTTAVSLLVIAAAFAAILLLRRRQARHGLPAA